MIAQLICNLPPGTRFRLFDDFVETPENDPDTALTRVRGTVRYISAGSACVSLDSAGTRTAVFTDRLTGERKEVKVQIPARTEHWATTTTVVPLEDKNETQG